MERDGLPLAIGTNESTGRTGRRLYRGASHADQEASGDLALSLPRVASLDATHRGDVFYAPLRLRIRPRKFREPDLLLVRSADDPRAGNEYWTGADLVVEIVSPDDPDRDHVAKRADYAEAGVPEYWIVDPQAETITVLQLAEAGYVEHGVFGRGATAPSVLFPEFDVSVDAVLDAT